MRLKERPTQRAEVKGMGATEESRKGSKRSRPFAPEPHLAVSALRRFKRTSARSRVSLETALSEKYWQPGHNLPQSLKLYL